MAGAHQRVLDRTLVPRRRRSGLGHAEELHEQAGHLLGVRVLEREHFNLRLLRRTGVQPPDDLFHQAHVIHRAADDERIHPRVRRDENPLLQRGRDELLPAFRARDELEHGLRVRTLLAQRRGLGVERRVENRGERLRPRILEREHLDLADARDLLGVEFLHQLTNAFRVRLAAGNHDGVDAFVGIHLHWQQRAGRVLAEQRLNRRRHAARIALRERKDMNAQARFGGVRVQRVDETLDRAHVVRRGPDEQRVHPRVGHDGDRIVQLALHLRRTVREDGLQRRLKLVRRRLLQREDTEVQLMKRALAIKLRHQALHHVERLLAAGHDDGIDPVIRQHAHRNASLVRVHGHCIARALGAEELFQRRRQRTGLRLLQRIDADVCGVREILGVHLLNDAFDDGQILRAGADEERVAARVHTDGQRIAWRALGGRARRHSRTVQPLLHEAVQHQGHALRVGKLQREGLENPAFHRRLDIHLRQQSLDQFQVLLARGNDERVVQWVGLHLDLLAGQRRLARKTLRLHPRRKDRLNHRGDAPGIIVLEREHGKRERRIVRLRVEPLQEIINGPVVFLVGRDEQAVAARVSEDDRLHLAHVARALRRVTLRKKRGQRRGHHPRIGVDHRDEPDASAHGRRRFIELLCQRFHHVEALASARDQQRVAPLIRENGHLQRVRTSLVQRGPLCHARIHQPLNARSHNICVSILQRHDADVAQIEGQLLIELKQQPFDDPEALAVARDHQRARAVVHANGRLVLGAN